MAGASSFARYLAAMQEAQGENIELRGDTVVQHGWRLMDGVALADAGLAFRAWNALWEGALAAHDRDRKLHTERSNDSVIWRVT